MNAKSFLPNLIADSVQIWHFFQLSRKYSYVIANDQKLLDMFIERVQVVKEEHLETSSDWYSIDEIVDEICSCSSLFSNVEIKKFYNTEIKEDFKRTIKSKKPEKIEKIEGAFELKKPIKKAVKKTKTTKTIKPAPPKSVFDGYNFTEKDKTYAINTLLKEIKLKIEKVEEIISSTYHQ